MNSLKFFTDITTNASNLCLLNIKRYSDKRKNDKDMIFIDPSVYELKKSNEYSKIELLHKIIPDLRSNEFISIDYPCDMNLQFQNEFIEKSIRNNFRYANNLHYICTIQYRFMDLSDFKNKFNELYSIMNIPDKIIGIGNLCRILKVNKTNKQFLDDLFKFLYENLPEKHLIHFYGLSANLIERYLPKMLTKFEISVDSTKWTKARRVWFKLENGICCKKVNRDKFFLHYLQELDIESIIF